jgi:hypothetical protein
MVIFHSYVNVYQRVSITIISINILQCPASDIWRLSQMFQIFPSNYCWYMTSSYFNWWHEGGPFLMGNLPSLAGEINQLRVVLSTRCLSQIKNLLRRFPFFCWLYRVPDWFSLLLATFQFFSFLDSIYCNLSFLSFYQWSIVKIPEFLLIYS